MASEVLKFTIFGEDEGASEAFEQVTDAMRGTIDFVKKSAAAVAAATAATVAFTSVVAKQIDEQVKFARRIGESVTQLTAYQYAAGLSGVETNVFNQSLSKLTVKMSEAAKGTGEAKNAIAELGIDAKAFTQLPLDEKLTLLSDRFGEVRTESDKLRLATKLFEQEGTAMLQMLDGNSAAMRAAAEDAKFLGLAISEDAAAQAEAFSDTMDRAMGSIKGMSNSIAAELMPLVGGLANRFADTLAQIRPLVANFVKATIEGFFTMGYVIDQIFTRIGEVFTDPAALVQFVKNIAELPKAIYSTLWEIVKVIPNTMQSMFKVVSTVVKSFVEWTGNSFQEIATIIPKAIAQGFLGAQKLVGEFAAWMRMAVTQVFKGGGTEGLGDALAESMLNAITSTKEQIQSTLSDFEGPGSAVDLAAIFLGGLNGVGDVAKETVNNLKNVLSHGASEIGDVVGTAFGVDLDEAQARAKAAIESLSLVASTTAESIKVTGEQLSEFDLALEERHREFMTWLSESTMQFVDTLYDTLQNTIDSLSQGMAQAIVAGQGMLEVFKNIAIQVTTSLIASLIKLGVQRMLFSALSKKTVTSEASAEAAKAVGLAGANMFASWAAAPWPISLGAPAAAASAMSGAAASFSAGAATGATLGAAIGGIAHGGLTNNPSEQTMLIRKDERILSPRQNADLTDALAGGGIGGGVNIAQLNITMFPNATNADAIFNMSTADLSYKIEDAVLNALNNLDKQGIRPNYVERSAV